MFIIPKSQYVIRQTKLKGRGVFVSCDLEPGTVIGDYLGKIVRPNEVDEIQQGGVYDMCYKDNALILPADPASIGIHCINHSCAPNCGIYPYKKGHKLFFALRRIFNGEELTVSYLMDIEERCNSCITHECFCQTPFCIGTIHSSKKTVARWNKLSRKRFLPYTEVPYGSNLFPLEKYPARIRDCSAFDIFGCLKEPPFVLKNRTLPQIQELRRLIRQSGRRLLFARMNLIVYGISGCFIITTKPH